MLLTNYLTTAWRNILRHKLFSAINILGLAIGLAAIMLITLFVRDELSYDKFWDNSENIYRLHMRFTTPGYDPEDFALSAPPALEAMAKDFPELNHFTRIENRDRAITIGENTYQDEVSLADRDIVEIFNFQILSGDINTALNDITGLVLDETTSNKYFGTTNSLGEVITIDMGDFKRDYKVTAVIKDIPDNSVLGFNMLALVNPEEWNYSQRWFNTAAMSFFTVKENTNIESMSELFPAYINRNFPSLPFGGPDLKVTDVLTISMMNIKDLHLKSAGSGEQWSPMGSMTTVIIFITVAVLILIIASINFMNLSTARASRRAKEVSLRKVMGAKRKHLIIQFIGESVLMTVIALLLALLSIELSLPYYNDIISKQLLIDYTSIDFLYIIILALMVGVLGGTYPAFILSNFRPAQILSSNQSSENKSSILLRTSLVIIQFTISIMLFVSTIVIFSQMKFTKQMDLGYKSDNLVSIYGNSREQLAAKINIIQQRFNSINGVANTTWTANFIPGSQGTGLDPIRAEQTNEYNPIMLTFRGIGYDFLKTYDIPLIVGRDYSRDRNDERATKEAILEGKGHTAGIILNQSAVRSLGLGSPEEAIGKMLYMNVGSTDEVVEAEFSVIGVIADLNIQSLKMAAGAEF
ncbi:MAG: FtsX-like permease family protein [Kordiimonadaceae bacterium]|nr:FtsX-like permease family protein [Kordiimonadaceae bacterium]